MSTKDYDPNGVVISLGPPIGEGATVTMEGFADGTFITVNRNNPNWSVMSGASGETARARSNDLTGTVELTLMQSSASNNILSAFLTADEATNSGKFSFYMEDGASGTVISAAEMWVQQAPTVEFGKELGDRVWTLETGQLVYGAVQGLLTDQEIVNAAAVAAPATTP